MYLPSLLVLLSATMAYRHFGRGRRMLFALTAATVVWALLAAVRFGLSQITGSGITQSVVYHFRMGLEGGDTSQYLPLVLGLATAVLAVLVGAILVARRLRTLGEGRRWGNPLASGLLALGILSNPFMTDLGKLAAFHYLPHGAGTDLAEPLPEALVPPKEKPNLVIVYMESLERSYLDQEQFPDLAPGLAALEQEALHATNLGQTEGATFTVGGMVASQCGLPLILPAGENSQASTDFLSGATCLGDVLNAAGYRTNYMGGADLVFAGKGSFYRSHGFDSVEGLNELKPTLADASYLGPWGLQDDTLFDLARERITALAATPEPFAFVTLTLDTHHPSGHADTNRSCQDITYGDGSNLMLNSIACADHLVTSFVRDIQAGPAGKNTIIVLASDHLAMTNGATETLDQMQRENLLIVLDPRSNGPRVIDRAATTLDTAPTLLSLLGFDVPQLGLGNDMLAADTSTLAETHAGQEQDFFADAIAANQGAVDLLWDKPNLSQGAYVNIETVRLDLSRSSTALPVLVLHDDDGAVTQLFARDPGADTTLAQLVLSHPDDSFLWIDDCRTLAFMVETPPPGATTCALSGALGKGKLPLITFDSSRLLTATEILPPTDEAVAPEEVEMRRARLLAIAMQDGAVPRDIVVPGLNSDVRGVILRSASAGRGNSLLRNQTTEALDAGDDKLPGRGISLVRVNPNGGSEILATYDPCDPDLDIAAALPFVTQIDPKAIHAILVHDTAICSDDGQLIKRVADGLDLPVLDKLAFREPYLAILPPDGPAIERSGLEAGRVAIRLLPLAAQSNLAATALADHLADVLARTPVLAASQTASPETPPETNAPPALAEAESTLPAAFPIPAPASACQPPPIIALGEPVEDLATGTDLSTGLATPDAQIKFGQGWWPAEESGRWLGADTGEIAIRLPGGEGAFTLALAVSAFAAETELVLKGPDGWSRTARPDENHTVTFDLAGLPRSAPIVLQIATAAAPNCPLDLGQGDSRYLSLMLKSLRLDQTAVVPVACVLATEDTGTKPSLALSVPGTIAVARDGTDHFGYGAGWWPGEPFGRWSGADEAHLRIKLDPKLAQPQLVLQGIAYAAEDLPVEAWFGDRKLATGRIGAKSVLRVPLDGLPTDQVLDLTLRFPDFALQCPSLRSESPDARGLAIMLQRVSLQANAGRQ